MERREFLASMGVSLPALWIRSRGSSAERLRPNPPLESVHFDIVRVSESVFAVRGKPNSGIPTNTAIVVGDDAVAVVDTHQRPSYDLEVIDVVGRITDLPIRYLVNTHWHQDHTLGNQAYEGRATIVAHANTRRDIVSRVGESLDLQRRVLPGQLEEARRHLDDRRREEGDGPALEQLALQIELDTAYAAELDDIRVVAPNRVFDDVLRLDIADPPIELRFAGEGHTRGDIVVFVPAERTLIFGDLLTPGQPFMRPDDAVPSGWGPTLAELSRLDWEHAVPGHGWIDDPRERVDILVRYLDDLTGRVRAAVSAGVGAEEITRAVDLSEYEPYFPYFRYSVGENIRRSYEELTAR